jgi:hypothetical protein
MRSYIVLLIILSVVGTATAATGVSSVEGVQAPSVVRSLVSGETITVFFTNGSASWSDLPRNTTRTYSFVVDENGVVTDVTREAGRNASYQAKVDIAFVRDAAEAQNTTAVLIDGYEDGRIAYRGVGAVNTVVAGAANAVTMIATTAYDAVRSVRTWVS